MDPITIFARLTATFLAALVFGLERQLSHKSMGFGTFIFVSIGGCMLGITAISAPIENSAVIIGAAVTGIGFLGAGALFRGQERVFGFTTAAAIWLFAIIGLVVGMGEYLIAAIAYIVLWVTAGFDKYLEHHAIGSYQRRVIVHTNALISEKEIQSYLGQYAKSYRTIGIEVDKGKGTMALTYLVSGNRENLNKMLQTMFREKWLESCKVE